MVGAGGVGAVGWGYVLGKDEQSLSGAPGEPEQRLSDPRGQLVR